MTMLERLSRRTLSLAFVAVIGLQWPFLRSQCVVINIYQPEVYDTDKSISIGLFSMGEGFVKPNFGPLETPRQVLLESLAKDLTATGYFSSVEVVAADTAKSTTDYQLKADILGVEGGSRLERTVKGGLGSTGKLRINGTLLGPPHKDESGRTVREAISDFECNAFDMGSWLGLGSNESAVRGSAEKTAESLSKAVFRRMDKRMAKLLEKNKRNEDRMPLLGKSKQINRKWREKQEWSVHDYEDEISSFVVRSKRGQDRGVDALWMTDALWTTHERLLAQLPQTAVLSSRDIKRGMVTNIKPIQTLRGQDAYVISLTFNVSANAAPFIWNSEAIRSATYLARADDPDIRVEPSEFLDRKLRSYVVFRERAVFKILQTFWAFHPTVIAFPRTTPEGQPLVRSLDDRIELHTSVDSRPVELTFDLRHFDLRTVDDLALSAPASKQ